MQDLRILCLIIVLILFLFYVYIGLKSLIILLSLIILISFIIFITRGTLGRFPLRLPVALAPGSQKLILKTKVHASEHKRKNLIPKVEETEKIMFYNTSFNKSVRDTNYGSSGDADISTTTRRNYSIHSPHRNQPVMNPILRQRRTPVTRRHSFSVRERHSPEKTLSDSVLNTSILPSIKRALGLETINNSRNFVADQNESYSSHPEVASPGFFPAVRLGRYNKHNLSHVRLSAMRSPNTVKIAPPDPQKLCSPRLLEVRNGSRETTPGARLTPDTQSVIIALKEKSRKRTANTIEQDNQYLDIPQQKAKRRRQESQQSNASTSSLPPMPDNLPDLSMSGYSIPRLETPTLKRSALMDNLDWEEEDQRSTPKRLRTEGRYNSIISSLSSSKRLAEMDTHSRENSPFGKRQKRRVEITDKENTNSVLQEKKKGAVEKDESQTPTLERQETVLLPPDTEDSNSERDLSIRGETTLETSQSLTPKLKQRVSLNNSVSARKRQMSLYSSLNKSFTKVPQANVVASMADYVADREAEQNRVQQMLDDIGSAEEKEKSRKAAVKQTTAVTNTGLTTTTTGLTSSVPGLSIPVTGITTTATGIKSTVASQSTGLTTQVNTSTAVAAPVVSSSVLSGQNLNSSGQAVTTSTAQTSDTGSKITFTPVFGKPTTATSTISTSVTTGVSTSTALGTTIFNMPAKTSASVNLPAMSSSGVAQSLFGSGVVSSTTLSLPQPQTSPLATPLTSTTGATSSGTTGFTFGLSQGSSSASLPSYNAALATKASTTTTQVTGFQMPQVVPSSQPPFYTAQNSGFQLGNTSTTGVVQSTSAPVGGVSSAQFTFNTGSHNTSTEQKASTSAAASSFTFGGNPSQTVNSTSGFGSTGTMSGFGGAQQNGTTGFGGATTANATPMFGGNTVTTKPSFTATAGFGVNKTQTTSSSIFGNTNPQFSSGGSMAQQSTASSVFGTTATQNGSGAPVFGAPTQIGTTGSTNQQSGTSIFGTNTTKSGSLFGTSTTQGTSSATAKPSFNPVFGVVATSVQTNGTSVFGTTTNSAGSSIFGGVSSNIKQTGTSTFGGNPSTSQATGTPLFGAVSSSTQGSGKPVFGRNPTDTPAAGKNLFGGPVQPNVNPFQSAGSGPVFGASTPQNTTTQSKPGGGVGSGAPVFSFVSGSNVTTPQANNKGFNFGGTAATSSFSFGGTNQVTSSTGFGGNQATSTPAFGANHATSTPAFGANQATGTPAFGANQTTSTPAFGANQATSTPAFGANQATSTPAFGANQATSTPAFGANQATSTPAFGANQTTSTPAFGANQATSTPAFGDSQSMGGMGSNMFSVGAGTTTPRPRVAARAKRRGPRR